jgi:hypothetical protein
MCGVGIALVRMNAMRSSVVPHAELFWEG